jgi:hypothetical protein
VEEDSGDLCGCLAFSEDDFGHASAQGAVMIDFREAEVLKGQVAQAVYRVVRRKFARADLCEEFADRFGVQEALSARHSAKPRLA